MIDLYAWNTPNGRKIPIMLEEAEFDYAIKLVDLDKGEQFDPDFLAISPNNKIPAIIDHAADGGPLAVFESGAILQYLADRSGRMLPSMAPARFEALQWLHWQVASFGPMLSLFSHAVANAEKMGKPAVRHFTEEAVRLFGVLDRRLAESAHVGGSDVTIADIAVYPWTESTHGQLKEATGKSWDHVTRWQDRMSKRPAFGRGMAAIG